MAEICGLHLDHAEVRAACVHRALTDSMCACSAPLTAPTGWLFWGLLGIAASPVVVGATAAACEALSPQVYAQLLLIDMHHAMGQKTLVFAINLAAIPPLLVEWAQHALQVTCG